MPRGRHRHEQPLHRLLPPAAVAAAALACAGGAWLVGTPGVADTDTVVLRALTAAAAAAAVAGAVLARRWDRGRARRVSELEARLSAAEGRAEERQAEHESESEKAGALRAALEKKLVAKRTELGRLRSEHAALLRRYATAETLRASALEGRRVLELESAGATETRALTTGAADHRNAAGAPTSLTYLQAVEALQRLKLSGERQRRLRAIEAVGSDGADVPAPAPATPVPPSAAVARQPGGGFDFFGAAKNPALAAASPSDDADDADDAPPPVAPPASPAPPARSRTAGKVFDLGAEEDDGDAPSLRGAV
ncbi:hypothetical protein [Streptomyces sp. TR06-5]|uniref:hypothetical protein n=1 Tax=Streptomyces sp. TR06-5 TaxID=3385976 RepID=UPI0039A3D0D0